MVESRDGSAGGRPGPLHRQTRNVMVYRLVARDTIEEKMMALQARKAELFSGLMDGGAPVPRGAVRPSP
jgi:hypothetical protein